MVQILRKRPTGCALALMVVVLSMLCCSPLHAQTAPAGPALLYTNSFASGNGDPIRLAVDAAGSVYVATPSSGKVSVYAQTGTLQRTISGFKRPMSVAVDAQSRVYVGDYGTGSVTVVGTSGQQLFSLGQGAGEFSMPGDLVIGPNGFAYVTDSSRNLVKAYDSTGTFQFAFGDTSATPGLLSFPTGIAADAVNQEIYVVDHNNGRIAVFDLSGIFKRSFGGIGAGAGRLTRPQGLAVSGGYVYVIDAYQSSIQIFDTVGTFISFIGQYGSGPGSFKIPMDIAVSGSKFFVANSDNERVEVFEDSSAVAGVSVSPSIISFVTTVNTPITGQAVQTSSLLSGSTVPWTATVSSSKVTLSQLAGTAPVPVTVGIDVAGLAAGSYTETVTFTPASGQAALLTVTLTVQAQTGGGGGGGTPPTITPGVWTTVPGKSGYAPALAWNPVTQVMQLVVVNQSGRIWSSTFNSSGTWNNDWTQVSGLTYAAPALAWNPVAQSMQLVVIGSTGKIWSSTFSSTGTWNNNWTQVPGSTPSPAALAWHPGAQAMQIVIRDVYNAMQVGTFGTTGAFNNNWQPITGDAASTPALSWNPSAQVMQLTTRAPLMPMRQATDEIYVSTFDSSGAFKDNWALVSGGQTTDSPATAWETASSEMATMVVGLDGKLWYASFNSAGAFNNNWTLLSGSPASAPACAWNAGVGMLQVVSRAADGSLSTMFY